MGAPLSYNLPRMDAAENVFFARELEQVRARSYDVLYAEKKSRMLLPVDHSIDPGVENVTFTTFNRFGVAKFISNYATDFPRADVSGVQATQAIKSLGASYGYSIQEIRAARFANKPLEQRKANAARQAIEDKIDSIGAVGDTANGLPGLLTLSSTGSYTVPNGASGTATWATKTSLEILKDLNGIVNGMIVATLEVEKPDTMILPIAQYADISTRPMFAVGGSDVTILEFFLRNTPYIKQVVSWDKCRGAGTSSTDRMVIYRRDPDALSFIISQEFEQFPPEPKGMTYQMACHARVGGVQVFYPLSISYGDGI